MQIAAQENGKVNILVRVDDMGASRSANLACVAAYEQGIVRSVEVMVPGAWFEEAVELLNERPDLDVGVHLTLTSEWSKIKWRPLTSALSITDTDGYFLPFVRGNPSIPQAGSLADSDWRLEEIERELRAHIWLEIKKIPSVSHLSEHMGCLQFSVETRELAVRLAEEYGLAVKIDDVTRFPNWSGSMVSAEEKVENLSREILALQPGTYLLVEHPAFDDFETDGLGHVGYENVAEDRYGVYKAFTDPAIARCIEQLGINLINYQSLALAN